MRPSGDGVERCDAIRALICARRLYEGGEITTRWIRKRFGVSESTARRDLRFIRLYLPVKYRRMAARGINSLRRLTIKEE